MKKAIIGKKVGMTQIFDETGKVIPVTVIEAGPCVVVQKMTKEKEGYEAVQFGYEEVAEKKLSNGEQGHLKKAGVGMVKHLKEFRLEDSSKLEVGDVIFSGPDADIKVGNALPVANIPVGTIIHNVELKPGKGAQLVRAAGNGAQLMAKEGKFASLRLQSGEVRKVRQECRATIGEVGNIDHQNIQIGKAGRKRHMGIRPTVRGSVMNPNDHPHGGGEGKAGIGRVSPVTPWGKPALGYKTRKKGKQSDKYIVKRRNEK